MAPCLLYRRQNTIRKISNREEEVMWKTRLLIPVCLLLFAASLPAQSIPTATLTGKVTSEGGAGLPGVTVTVESPNLQGKRDTSSGANGDYIFNLLPAGDYTVTFGLSGMQNIVQKISLQAARTARVDAELKPSNVKEAVVVSADSNPAAILEETQVSANYKKGLIEKLPTARTLQAVTLLA